MRGFQARVVLSVVAIAVGLALPQAALGAPVVASFTFSPSSPLTGEVVTFTSNSTGTITSQDWDLDGDGTCDDASGPIVQRSFPIAQPYSVTLCLNGNAARQTQTVTVRNRPPTASFVQSPPSPVVGDTVTLTSTSSDADGPIVSQAWDLQGDGKYDDGVGTSSVSRSFPRAGSYRVGLRVVDRDGAAGVSSRTIRVTGRAVAAATLLSPFPVVRMISTLTPTGVDVGLLTVRAPRGSQVVLRCRGRDCPYRRKSREVIRGGIRFARLERNLRRGVVIKIFVTKANRVGKYTSFRIRRGRRPARADRCLAPGSNQPRLCSSFSGA